jgi:hypothetical protein
MHNGKIASPANRNRMAINSSPGIESTTTFAAIQPTPANNDVISNIVSPRMRLP